MSCASILLLARSEQFSPLVPKGSFAGALGVPQFMPGSVRRYAIDFDGDGHIDLWNSGDDAIGSVANYLARHDWLRGQPIWSRATIAPSARDSALLRLDGGISERRPLAAWNADGVAAERCPIRWPPDPSGLLALEEPPEAETGGVGLWIAFPNFYVDHALQQEPALCGGGHVARRAHTRRQPDGTDFSAFADCSLRTCATSARVDGSTSSGSDASAESAATIGFASVLPSSTPH